MVNYEVLDALDRICREKGIDRCFLLETLEASLLSACKKKFGSVDNIEVAIDEEKGEIGIRARKRVVEQCLKPELEIELVEARRIDPKVKIGDEIKVDVPLQDFGRSAIQLAKQIVLQRVREAERERIFNHYKEKVGDIASGTIQHIEKGDLIVNLGRTEAVIPLKEQIHSERYRQGNNIRAYIMNIQKTTKGPQVFLSRAHPEFLKKLFFLEVPEIHEGIVEIKAVAREPGERAKIAVSSKNDKIDPVGTCVGLKGTRVRSVVTELAGEKIDIVHWNPDLATFVSRALAPAKGLRVLTKNKEKRVTVITPDDQLSLAIGKRGQNVRLAAKLCGCRIDIFSESEYRKRMEAEEREKIEVASLTSLTPRIQTKLKQAGLESVEEIEKKGTGALLAIPGIGEKTAQKILAAVKEALSKKGEQKGAELKGEEALPREKINCD